MQEFYVTKVIPCIRKVINRKIFETFKTWGNEGELVIILDIILYISIGICSPYLVEGAIWVTINNIMHEAHFSVYKEFVKRKYV